MKITNCRTLNCHNKVHLKGKLCFYCSREKYRLFNYTQHYSNDNCHIYQIKPLSGGKLPRCHHVIYYFMYNTPELSISDPNNYYYGVNAGFSRHIDTTSNYWQPQSMNSLSDIEKYYGLNDIYAPSGFKHGLISMDGNGGYAVYKTNDNKMWVVDLS